MFDLGLDIAIVANRIEVTNALNLDIDPEMDEFQADVISEDGFIFNLHGSRPGNRGAIFYEDRQWVGLKGPLLFCVDVSTTKGDTFAVVKGVYHSQ